MDASKLLGLVYAAQLERERQILKGYDSAHDASHTAGSGWRWFRSMRIC